MKKQRVLIGSPIRQKPAILKEFLNSLKVLDKTDLVVDFMFVEDNEQVESKEILANFKCQKSKIIIINGAKVGKYVRDETDHHWTSTLVTKVAEYKDQIICYALENDYDYLFLIDSDIVLHPRTLTHLVATNKDIISEIFWTQFKLEQPILPQVWVKDEYTLYYQHSGEQLTKEEIVSRIKGYLNCLKIPGIYPVGGLGASTLISKKALQRGVCFKELDNLSFVGEDRHFCIRAVALGLELYVDNHYPAYHIYRETDLPGVQDFNTQCTNSLPREIKPMRTNIKSTGNKLTLCMVVKNEANRYLSIVLQHARQYIDEAVILDDGSDDDTVTICKEILKGKPLKLITNQQSQFQDGESKLRQQLWQHTISTNPDWILCLDADEMFEDAVFREISRLINQPYYDYFSFRLYDFWNTTHYREDKYWQAHKYYRTFLIRYQPNFDYHWREAALHSGRFPANIAELPGAISKLRIKHLGWLNPIDRIIKYRRYMEWDPEGKYGILGQYEAILDLNPNLVKWED